MLCIVGLCNFSNQNNNCEHQTQLSRKSKISLFLKEIYFSASQTIHFIFLSEQCTLVSHIPWTNTPFSSTPYPSNRLQVRSLDIPSISFCQALSSYTLYLIQEAHLLESHHQKDIQLPFSNLLNHHIFLSLNNFLPSLPLSFYHSHPSLFPLPFSSPLLVYVFVTCDRNISRDDICALTPKPQSVRFMCLPPMSQCLSSQEASGCCRLFIPIYPLSI